MRRIFRAIGGPPGSTVSITVRPIPRSRPASRRIWVVLPEPSMPSKAMKKPRIAMGTSIVGGLRTDRRLADNEKRSLPLCADTGNSVAPVLPYSGDAMNFDQCPMLVIWEVTQACDLACVHCRASAQSERSPGELTTEQGYRLLDEIRSFGEPLMVFTGGDPLKRPDLYDLIRYSVK